MRLKQDPMYTRFGATHVFLEPCDAMFDVKPTRPVPSFTRRKKVNRVYRRNRAGRKILVHIFYNVAVGAEAVIIGEDAGDLGQEAVVLEVVDLGGEAEVLEVVDLGGEAEVLEVVDLGGEAEVLEVVDPGAGPEVQEQALLDEAVGPGAGPEVQEQAFLDEGDEADHLASLLEAKGAAGAAK